MGWHFMGGQAGDREAVGNLPVAGLWQNGQLLAVGDAKRSAGCEQAHEKRAQHVGWQVWEVGSQTSVTETCVMRGCLNMSHALAMLNTYVPAFVDDLDHRSEDFKVAPRDRGKQAPSDVRQTPKEPLHAPEKKRSRYMRVSTPS